MSMSDPSLQSLSDVVETALVPLYVRAIELQRPDALFKDGKAVELVEEMGYDFSRIKQAQLNEETRLALVLRTREFDRKAQDFLMRCPEGVVIHIGCGLDKRFERMDNG